MKFATVLLSLAMALPLAATAAQRHQRMDTNGDGKISREEWKGPTDMFDKLDATTTPLSQATNGPAVAVLT